jgi:hypothetical protein
VRDLGSGIQVYPIAGEGNRKDVATSARLHQQNRWILHRHLRAQVAINPFHRGVSVDRGTLRDEVVDVLRPVLDGRVAHASTFHNFDLDNGAVQAVAGIGWGCTPLNIVHIRARGGNNQRALELTYVLRIDTEVGLQGDFHAHALWYIDKAATTPHRAVERGEFIIRRRNNGAEVLFDDVGILAQRCIHVGEDHAQFLKVFAYLVVDRFTLVLRRHARQVVLFSLWNTQPIKGVLNFCWDITPGLALLRDWFDIVVDLVKVYPREVRAPRWQRTLFEEAQALETELPHPTGLALHFGDLLNGLLAQSSRT